MDRKTRAAFFEDRAEAAERHAGELRDEAALEDESAQRYRELESYERRMSYHEQHDDDDASQTAACAICHPRCPECDDRVTDHRDEPTLNSSGGLTAGCVATRGLARCACSRTLRSLLAAVAA